MPGHGIALGDILADSGYAHRDAGAWAIPLRAAGAQLIQDLHPHDRGPQGTHAGAIIANGNLYCPATPRPLLELGPLPRDATPEDTAAHDTQAGELARHKLGRITTDDADGYHRITCPAATGKLRCPLRPRSMTRDRSRPEILTPPEHRRPAAPSRPSPSPRRPRRRPGRSTTTRPRPTDAPTPAAPAPSARFPPSRTPPPATSPAAGAASPACPRRTCGWPACSPSATSESWTPGMPARPRTPAAPPPGSRPKPGAAGARPSLASPPARPSDTGKPRMPAHQATRTTVPHALIQPRRPPKPRPPAHPRSSQATAARMSELNVNMIPTET